MKNVRTLLDQIRYLLNIQAKALNTHSLLKKKLLSLPEWKVTNEIKCRVNFWCWNIPSTCHFVKLQIALSIGEGEGVKLCGKMGAKSLG
jgi:hypothetical protein